MLAHQWTLRGIRAKVWGTLLWESGRVDLTFDWGCVILGCVGGAVPDVIRFTSFRQSKCPEYVKTFYFWLCVSFLVLLGGLAAFLMQTNDIKAAFAFGFTAPELLTGFGHRYGPGGHPTGNSWANEKGQEKGIKNRADGKEKLEGEEDGGDEVFFVSDGEKPTLVEIAKDWWGY